MAVLALHSAASGLSALSTELDVIANNLANVNTTGFKASRANFEDLLYQEKLQPGVENENGDQRPAGLYVGLGTRISNTQFDWSQGSVIPSNNHLDLAIDGTGFFRVTIPADQGGVAYTRSGNLFLNKDGEVVLGNSDGPRLEPPLTVGEDIVSLNILSNGQVFGVRADNTQEELGQIELSGFVNPAGLTKLGGNLFIESAASGPPIAGTPGEGKMGKILQYHLEASNVDSVNQLVSLIKTQRAFEMNSQTIQAADEAMQVISNLRRF